MAALDEFFDADVLDPLSRLLQSMEDRLATCSPSQLLDFFEFARVQRVEAFQQGFSNEERRARQALMILAGYFLGESSER